MPDTQGLLNLVFDADNRAFRVSGGGAVSSVDGQTGAVSLSGSYAPIAEPLSALTVISRTVLASPAATIDLTSIPATYENLQLHFMGRGDTNAASMVLSLRVNGDTGGNYDRQVTGGNNATTTSASSMGQTSLAVTTVPAATATAGRAGVAIFDFPNYARTVFNKMILYRVGHVSGTGAGNIDTGMDTGNWRSTAAINQLTLIPSAGNFDTGTVVTLLGIKGA